MGALLRSAAPAYKSMRRLREKAPMQHLAALLDAACARWPGRVALIGDGGEMRYGEIDGEAGIIAAELRAAGIGRDEPVAVRVSNRSGVIAAFLGAWRAGGVVVQVHRTA